MPDPIDHDLRPPKAGERPALEGGSVTIREIWYQPLKTGPGAARRDRRISPAGAA
jgi:hypothetical protein